MGNVLKIELDKIEIDKKLELDEKGLKINKFKIITAIEALGEVGEYITKEYHRLNPDLYLFKLYSSDVRGHNPFLEKVDKMKNNGTYKETTGEIENYKEADLVSVAKYFETSVALSEMKKSFKILSHVIITRDQGYIDKKGNDQSPIYEGHPKDSILNYIDFIISMNNIVPATPEEKTKLINLPKKITLDINKFLS